MVSTSSHQSNNVVVIGCGVSGLTCAMLLQDAGYRVRIIAEFCPDDFQERPLDYCSMWAGAHHVTFANASVDKEQFAYDKTTFEWMRSKLEENSEEMSFLMWIRETEMYTTLPDDGEGPETFRLFMPNFRSMSAHELPEDVVEGCQFDTLSINAPKYLAWLYQRFQSRGGTIVKRKLKRVSSAIDEADPPLAVFNCTGLGSKELLGDTQMFPVRGQTVVVEAPWLEKAGFTKRTKGAPTAAYVVPRSDGTVVLGGTREKDDWEGKARQATTERICKECIKIMPNLLPEDKRANKDWRDLKILAENVGLRPSRRGGIRVHVELATTKHGAQVVLAHNYGHGGEGFQSSYGAAKHAVELFERAKQKLKSRAN